MSTETPSGPTTPEPVRNASDAQAWFLRLLGGAAVLTGYYGWWNPTGDDLLVIAGFASVVYSSIVDIVGRITRKKVVPIQNVALTVSDVKAIELAEAPPVSFNTRANVVDGPAGMFGPQ